MSIIVEAAGFLLFTKSEPLRFLLMKHADRWDLPKGHAEEGEDLLQAALRETAEETGIPPEKICVDETFRFVVEYAVRGKKCGDYQKRVTYFLGSVDEPCDVELTEHIGSEWRQWPAKGSIQSQTIDPLLAAVARHFAANSNAATPS